MDFASTETAFSLLQRGTCQLPWTAGLTFVPTSSATLQEIQALAAMGSHSHIVQYYNSWTEADQSGCGHGTYAFFSD